MSIDVPRGPGPAGQMNLWTLVFVLTVLHFISSISYNRKWTARHTTSGSLFWIVNLLGGALVTTHIVYLILVDQSNPYLPFHGVTRVLLQCGTVLCLSLSVYTAQGLGVYGEKDTSSDPPVFQKIMRPLLIIAAAVDLFLQSGISHIPVEIATMDVTVIKSLLCLDLVWLCLLDTTYQPGHLSEPNESWLPGPNFGPQSYFTSNSYSFVTNLITFGVHHEITPEDIPELPYAKSVSVLSSELRTIIRSNLRNEEPLPLWRVLFQWRRSLFAKALSIKLFYDCINFINPILINRLIHQITLIGIARADGSASVSDALQKGIVIVAIMATMKLLGTSILQRYFLLVSSVGYELRTALTDLIYRKSVIGVSSDQSEDPSNLVNVDCTRLNDICMYLLVGISGPFQICIAVSELWIVLGPSGLVALLVMTLSIPLVKFLSTLFLQRQKVVMALKDLRTKRIGEILQSMTIIKLYAWEEVFDESIQDLRDEELAAYYESRKISIAQSSLWFSIPEVVALSTFSVHTVLMGRELTPAIVFTAVALFNLLRFPLNMLPMVMSQCIEAYLATTRIESVLKNADVPPRPDNMDPFDDQAPCVTIKSGTFYYVGSQRVPIFSTKNQIHIERGSTTFITGRVGSGKTAILRTLAGEACCADPRLSPLEMVNCNGMTYASQDPWLFNATIKQNIVFLEQYDEIRYLKVIKASALEREFNSFPKSDQTMVGERGTQLSGGQKARISLARALYSHNEVILLDDILASLDERSSFVVLNQLFGNQDSLLKNRTVVMSTHFTPAFSYADRLWLVGKNTQGVTSIRLEGPPDQVLSNPFYQSEMGHLLAHGDGTAGDSTQGIPIPDLSPSSVATEPSPSLISFGRELVRSASGILVEPGSPMYCPESETISTATPMKSFHIPADLPQTRRMMTVAFDPMFDDDDGTATSILVATESHDKPALGWIGFKAYRWYFSDLGPWVYMMLFGIMIAGGLRIFGQMWLAFWSEAGTKGDHPTWVLDKLMHGAKITAFTGSATLSVIVFFQLSTYAFGIFAESMGALAAAKKWHDTIMTRLWNVPVDFFDRVPTGFILGRISKDIYVIDEVLPRTLRSWLLQVVACVGSISVMLYTTPTSWPMFIVVGVLYLIAQYIFIPSYRQLQRVESSLRSDLISHLHQSATGAESVRAYGCQQQFIATMKHMIDKTGKANYYRLLSTRWLAWRLEFLGNMICVTIGTFAMMTAGKRIGPALAGLAISYADNITQSLNWLVRMAADVESNMISVERLKNTVEGPQQLEQEAARHLPSDDVLRQAGWPQCGALSFDNISVTYPTRAEAAVESVTFQVQAQEKLGIIGHTGSGKTSLLNAVLRVVELSQGRILIDGEDCSQIGLSLLRSAITVIPQDPTFFLGSLRWNLDPTHEHTDEVILKALRDVEMGPWLKGLDGGLDHRVLLGGSNISRGQRQLLCLARALLKQSKILILDEATASVDTRTDHLIQTMIRANFSSMTVIAIAHRLSTLVDYDRLVLMGDGVVKDIGSPEEIMSRHHELATRSPAGPD